MVVAAGRWFSQVSRAV